MKLFTVWKNNKALYYLDLTFYSVAVVALAGLTGFRIPYAQIPVVTAMAFSGVVIWTLLEYVIHRFVFHGIRPFRDWHEEHHRQPTDLIVTSTLASASLIAVLVFVPAWLWDGWRMGAALTLGITIGYTAYGWMHHAMHHSRWRNQWFRQRRQLHALHHRKATQCCYGVTSSIWDMVFGTHATDAGNGRPPARAA